MTEYLCMDFETNRHAVKNEKNRLFSAGVERQYGNLSEARPGGYNDFVRGLLLEPAMVHISYPNFERAVTSDAKGNRFYNNVAVRIPRGEQDDLVFMGDIIERAQNRHRQFVVKSIQTMSPVIRHHGEISRECEIVARLGKQWEDRLGVHQFLTDPVVRCSVLTNNLMVELNRTYVVDDVRRVEGILDGWDEFVSTRRSIIDRDSREGYDLTDAPEALKAYAVDGALPAGVEPLPHLICKNRLWTVDAVDGAREVAVIRLHQDFLSAEFNGAGNGKDPKKVFDGFTRGPLAIVDPSVLDKDKRPKRIVELRDCRIAVSSREDIPPNDELEAIERSRAAEKKKARDRMSQNLRDDVEGALDDYRRGPLEAEVRAHVESQREAVTSKRKAEIERRTAEARRKLDAIPPTEGLEFEQRRLSIELGAARARLEVASSDLKSAPEDGEGREDLVKAEAEVRREFSRIQAELKKIHGLMSRREDAEKELAAIPAAETLVKADLEAIADGFRKRANEAERARLEDKLAPIHEAECERECARIDADCDERGEEAVRERTVVRLHMHFEAEVPESQRADVVAKDIAKRMRPGLRLCKDYTGDRVVLDRQSNALKSLRDGYVMNPFIATALFEPENTGSADPRAAAGIDTFHQDRLNAIQKDAVRKACSSRGMFLIQGPPGTGKTQVIAEITTQIALSGRKVLIASENHKAVDNAFSRLPRISAIRPMRIMSREKRSKDETSYAPEDLLRNFYASISTSLEEEISRNDSIEEYIRDLDADMEELESMLGRIERCMADNRAVQDEIAGLEADRRRAHDKKEKSSLENNRIEQELERLRDQMDAVGSLEGDDLLKRARAAAAGAGLGNLPSDEAPLRGLLLRLTGCGNGDIWNEVDRIEEHPSFVDDLLGRRAATEAKDIAAINRRIKEYEEEHGVDRSGFPILNALGARFDGAKAVAAKTALEDLIEEETAGISRDIAKNESRLVHVSEESLNKYQRRIDELKAGPENTRYEEARTRFSTKALEVMRKMHMGSGSGEPSDVLEDIKLEAGRVKGDRTNASQKDRMNVYRRIVKTLGDDSVVEADSERYNRELMNAVNVIGMTCTTGDRFDGLDEERINLSDLNIDVVIVDEVSKVPFVELLQPILYGKTVILVGDHRQLAPMYTSMVDRDEYDRYEGLITPEMDERFREIYTRSFFEDLFRRSPESNKTVLNIQYRMHPQIMDVDNVFYAGALEFGGLRESKEHRLSIKGAGGTTVIGPGDHVVFIDCKGREFQESGSTSFRNDLEARVVEKLLADIDGACRCDRDGKPLRSDYRRNGDTRLSAGVICAYADQARAIRGGRRVRYQSFNATPDDRFMVKTVDDFQGDERDIIILSMVRTRNSPFLADYHRINVAVSRARRLLIVVGNADALERINVEIDGDDGRKVRKPVYRNMIEQIRRSGKVLSSADILGGE